MPMQTLTLSQDSAQLPGTNTMYLEATGGTDCTGASFGSKPNSRPGRRNTQTSCDVLGGVTVRDTQWDLISL